MKTRTCINSNASAALDTLTELPLKEGGANVSLYMYMLAKGYVRTPPQGPSAAQTVLAPNAPLPVTKLASVALTGAAAHFNVFPVTKKSAEPGDPRRICGGEICLYVAHGSRVGLVEPAGSLNRSVYGFSSVSEAVRKGNLTAATRRALYPLFNSFKAATPFGQSLAALPAVEDVHVRKLWEAVTHVVSETLPMDDEQAWEADSSPNKISGGVGRACGGVPFDARSGNQSAAGNASACEMIQRSAHLFQPNFFTVRLPIVREPLDPDIQPQKSPPASPPEMGGIGQPDFAEGIRVLRASSCAVILVRNPVDQYYATLQELNQTGGLSAIEELNLPNAPLDFDSYLRRWWLPYAQLTAPWPTFVIRHEVRAEAVDAFPVPHANLETLLVPLACGHVIGRLLPVGTVEAMFPFWHLFGHARPEQTIIRGHAEGQSKLSNRGHAEGPEQTIIRGHAEGQEQLSFEVTLRAGQPTIRGHARSGGTLMRTCMQDPIGTVLEWMAATGVWKRLHLSKMQIVERVRQLERATRDVPYLRPQQVAGEGLRALRHLLPALLEPDVRAALSELGYVYYAREPRAALEALGNPEIPEQQRIRQGRRELVYEAEGLTLPQFSGIDPLWGSYHWQTKEDVQARQARQAEWMTLWTRLGLLICMTFVFAGIYVDYRSRFPKSKTTRAQVWEYRLQQAVGRLAP
ncbi:hypothetical protein CYMTET_6023 [Cymbomonas tetramitiformis]|uniref:Uncharacterized protein n=1 Tax=Cymbomonas tetramitiformis TaxID=36881 RepID=A0AAE0GYA2_9CHLO|nr:hypothetical protein CYMTET_6023 [Cymbomonas tetramitiformis]